MAHERRASSVATMHRRFQHAISTLRPFIRAVQVFSKGYAIKITVSLPVAFALADPDKHRREKSPYTVSLPMQVRLCIKRGYQRLRGDMANTITGIVFNAVMALGTYSGEEISFATILIIIGNQSLGVSFTIYLIQRGLSIAVELCYFSRFCWQPLLA